MNCCLFISTCNETGYFLESGYNHTKRCECFDRYSNTMCGFLLNEEFYHTRNPKMRYPDETYFSRELEDFNSLNFDGADESWYSTFYNNRESDVEQQILELLDR